MFISEALAAAPQVNAEQGSAIASLLPFLLILVIFYFLMIRPQQKKYKSHQQMLHDIARGDKVVTGGGIISKVTKVEDTILHVEIAKDVVVQVAKASIGNVLESKAKKAEADKEKSKKTAEKVVKKKIANDN